MESQHMTQQVFANYLELSPASLSSIFNDRTRPTINIVEAIKKKFPNISTDWLLFGTGDMYVHSSDGEEVAAADGQQAAEPVLDFGDTPQASSPLPASTGSRKSVVAPAVSDVKIINKVQRNITEIRVFYDDQTWETFVPQRPEK